MWAYIPRATSTPSPSAPEGEGSTSESSWQSQAFARSFTWRGKPSPSRAWSQRLKKVTWLRLLSGRMPEPSQAAASADAWISSLGASLASRTPSPASALGEKTSAIFGARPGASSSSPEPGRFSSRTSAGCSHPAAPSVYGQTFAAWASELREDCSRRQKSARRRSASASSSSAWPTPRSEMARALGNPKHLGGRRGNGNIEDRVAAWATPTAHGRTHTPRRVDHGQQLANQVDRWSTPAVADVMGGRKSRSGARSSELLLNGQAERLSSLQAPTITTDGAPSSVSGRRLNPLFVEWLMGWPAGWTRFACSATELSRFKQRMRSELSHLGLPPNPPAQWSLFG